MDENWGYPRASPYARLGDEATLSIVRAQAGVRLVKPPPNDPVEGAAWRQRLRVAAEDALPDWFAMTVRTVGGPVSLNFELTTLPDTDPEERCYRLVEPVIAHLTLDEPSVEVEAGGLTFRGRRLVGDALADKVRDFLVPRVSGALSTFPVADLATTLLELHQAVREPVGVSASPDPDGGIPAIQHRIAAILSRQTVLATADQSASATEQP